MNIIKTGLTSLNLIPGPWLSEFKQALYKGADPAVSFEVRFDRQSPAKHFILGELADKIARITPGQKISYITDVTFSRSNQERIVELVKESDHLFIEAVFLDRDCDIAEKKQHLTARQAGYLAATAKAKQFTVFHFSPRYMGEELKLRQEARKAYENTLKAQG